ncbi:DUF5677 domain-containing protein [Flavobacterium sp. 102]|uniref:DUF5677 domain-containing protein n=1 Tax=Flavobacterium sp. 102 TaxID=2135623 RepID=UPI000EB17B52|nr:DUF5677 domain-containing protein [Flavobacterium sp. 102]RKS03024.1 hypothetical protein C8C84_2764 [Flavobacterium sp. 102]
MDIQKLLYQNPLTFYEYILLGPLAQVYVAKKKTNVPNWMNYSNLLIDKFAIHSSSFFHLSSGIIEHKSSTPDIKVTGYDLFSVNSMFRVMMETYITFNHIFVEPKSEDEKQFRFYLWKIDGLLEKKKFKIDYENLPKLKPVQEKDKQELQEMFELIKTNSFYNSLETTELVKIYDPEKRKSLWKFSINENYKVRPLKIIELVEQVCKTDAFINAYKYASVHTHSNYISIEHFEKTRSKPISEEYTDPLTRLAIYLTALIIEDICKIDENAGSQFTSLPAFFQDFITGINKSIRS